MPLKITGLPRWLAAKMRSVYNCPYPIGNSSVMFIEFWYYWTHCSVNKPHTRSVYSVNILTTESVIVTKHTEWVSVDTTERRPALSVTHRSPHWPSVAPVPLFVVYFPLLLVCLCNTICALLKCTHWQPLAVTKSHWKSPKVSPLSFDRFDSFESLLPIDYPP